MWLDRFNSLTCSEYCKQYLSVCLFSSLCLSLLIYLFFPLIDCIALNCKTFKLKKIKLSGYAFSSQANLNFDLTNFFNLVDENADYKLNLLGTLQTKQITLFF